MKETEYLFFAASEAWERGNSKVAFDLFLRAARLGDDGAQLNLAHFYYSGEAVRKDIDKALYWYKNAWKNGQHTSACTNIAQVYAEIGQRRRAIYWWKKAVDRDDGDAALELAKFLSQNANLRSIPIIEKLLKIASTSEHISPAGLEEAIALNQSRTSKGSNPQ